MLVASTLACYAAINLAVVNLAVVVTHVAVPVEVVDDATSAPVVGARVAEVGPGGASACAGVTDARGAISIELVIGQRHEWLWPKVALLAVHGRALRVEAAGFAPADVALVGSVLVAPFCGGLPPVRVRLRRE